MYLVLIAIRSKNLEDYVFTCTLIKLFLEITFSLNQSPKPGYTLAKKFMEKKQVLEWRNDDYLPFLLNQREGKRSAQ